MKLTLDIGGSKTRGFLYSNNPPEKIEFLGGFGKAEDCEEVEPLLFHTLQAILGDRANKIEAIAVNLGGKNKRQITQTLITLCPAARIGVYRESEGILAHKIMQTHTANVLIMAGTGCIVFCKSPTGSRVLGGWGKDYGDEGSGYSIGMKAVRYALKELDSGADQLPLLPQALFSLTTAFQFRNMEEYASARDSVRAKIPKTREGIAALTKTVVACAKQGCPISKRILAETGEELADLVLRSIQASAISTPSVIINGGVTNFYSLWKDAFFTKLQQKNATATVICFNDGIDEALKELLKEL